MRSRIKIIISGIIVFFSIHTFSQSGNYSENLKPWRLKNYGRNAIRNGDIFAAIDYYEKYYSRKPNDGKTVLKLAGLYRESRDYVKARDLYLKVYRSDSVKYIKALFYYALMYKMDCNYEAAGIYFNKFKNEYKNLKADKKFGAILSNELEGCNLYEMTNAKISAIKITHLDTSINKTHVEFSPLPVDENTFVYASLRSDTVKYTLDENGRLKMPVREFYKAIKKHDKWVGGYDSPFPFNETNVNVGNGVLSKDGLRFYYTRCEEKVSSRLICAIYLSKKVNRKWGKSTKLENEINISGYTSTQPAIGSNSKNNNEVLYFVSDRKEGRGGLDIWYVEYDSRNDQFKVPKNCGGAINTSSDEVTPFYDFETRSLYFSSSGFPGMGGFDIFRSTGELKQWSKPENIGPPVNSCTDDIYYVIGKNRDEGFFVSNRKGGIALKSETCCDDIYSYTWLNKINLYAKGLVISVDSNIIIGILNKTMKDTIREWPPKKIRMKNAIVSLFLHDMETHQKFLIRKQTTNENGEYFFTVEPGKDYSFVVDTAGFFSKEVCMTTQNINHSDTIRLKPIELLYIPKEPIVIKNIYYPFDKSSLTDDSKKCIDTTILKVMNKLPDIIVEISSYSDSKGDDAYNLKLSRRRAESVVNYLISKGISKNRLIAKGCGKTKAIATNTNPDGSDNPEGRARNRRTEFRITGSLKEAYSKVIYDE
ncbi:MAG: OmpA family protein [Bacteroidia bacterium]|nr:OmpA family protein [Bacteroidia bacterium]